MKMLNQIILLLSLILLISCQPSEKKEAILLIKKSIEAHGGQDTWAEIQTLSLEKETWLSLSI